MGPGRRVRILGVVAALVASACAEGPKYHPKDGGPNQDAPGQAGSAGAVGGSGAFASGSGGININAGGSGGTAGAPSSGAIGGTAGTNGGGAAMPGSGGTGVSSNGGTNLPGTGGMISSSGGAQGETGGSTPKPGLGAPCDTASQCGSGHCADGVCCNRACAGACEACNSAGGDGPGMCRYVLGATMPGHATCAGTGACAGTCKGTSAACSYPSGETICGAPTCNNGSATSAATCDGAGSCPASSTTVCAPFVCGAQSCLKTCSGSADCVSGDYCSAPNQSCLPKKGLGSTCSSFDECTSSICGGRCCSSACTCPQPTTDNLFKNAGFDSNLSGWEMFVGTTTGVQWTSDDADGCPFSGSAKIIASLGNPAQCVAIAPGSYNVGGWFKNADGNSYFCSFQTYPNPSCADPATSMTRLEGNETKWTFRNGMLVIPDGNMSVMFRCDANPNTFIDKLFLSKGGF